MSAFYYFCGHEQFQPEVLVSHAVLAEEAGFDGVVVSDHFHPWVDDRSAAGFAFSTLGAISQATSRIRLTTGVTSPLFRYHPALVAQAAATVDRLSAGRFDLGVGTGENINEGPLGYTFPKYPEREARMREALEIIRRLLDGEKLTFQGKYYRTDRARLYSPPVSKVPILLAAGGPQSAVLAAQMAEGIITSVKSAAQTIARVVDPAVRAATAASRPPPWLLATRWSVHASDATEAWEALLSWRGLRAPKRLEAVDPQTLRERADALPREEIIDRYTLVPDTDAIVEAYRPLIDDLEADAVTFQISSLDQEATIRLIGEEVLPKLRLQRR